MNTEIHANRYRIPYTIFLGLGIFSLSLYLFLADDGTVPFFYYRAFFLVLMVYGGMLTVVAVLDYIKTVFDAKARLILTPETLNDNLSILSVGSVAWSELSVVSVKKIKRINLQFLVVALTDQDRYLKNKNPVIRYILKRYIKIFGGIIVISEKRIAYAIQKLR
jgi:hypothetical protein